MTAELSYEDHVGLLRGQDPALADEVGPLRRRRNKMSVGTAFHERTAPLNRKMVWREWAGYFALGAGKRAAAEAGIPRVVTPREADDLLRAAEQFVAVVESALGVAYQPPLDHVSFSPQRAA